jgi:hypothetical protein
MHRAVLLLLLTFLIQDATAQWVNHPTPGTPRTRDGKPILTARTPRAPNGSISSPHPVGMSLGRRAGRPML